TGQFRTDSVNALVELVINGSIDRQRSKQPGRGILKTFHDELWISCRLATCGLASEGPGCNASSGSGSWDSLGCRQQVCILPDSMRVTSEVVRLTHALLRPDTVLAAIEALRGMSERAAVEGLVELLYDTSSARATTAAVSALEGRDDPPVLDALAAALDSPHASVRIVAVQSLHQRRADHVADHFFRLLTTDDSWLVRRAALRALADQPAPHRWRILDAATDPHWRVRHALIRVLLEWGDTEESRRDIEQRLARLGEDVRVEGVRVYLTYRWSGRAPKEINLRPDEDPNHLCPFCHSHLPVPAPPPPPLS